MVRLTLFVTKAYVDVFKDIFHDCFDVFDGSGNKGTKP